jgi:hypothetical protein
MRFHLGIGLAIILAVPVSAMAIPATALAVEGVGDSISFSVSARTEVPGTTLKPGTYSIRVVDHLSDRVILRIEDLRGKTLATFLGLPNPTIRSAASNGPINWPNGPHKQSALRGFAFPGGNAVEFVYSKADAVEIAKVNTSKVAAIDPASEGRSSNDKKLSEADLQLLTLWSLSSTRVGPENASQPAIAAERYQPVQEARNVVPPAPGAGAQTLPTNAGSENTSQSSRTGAVSRPRTSASVLRAVPVARRPALMVLPHTASYSPTIFLSGIVALLIAGALWFGRRAGNAA